MTVLCVCVAAGVYYCTFGCDFSMRCSAGPIPGSTCKQTSILCYTGKPLIINLFAIQFWPFFSFGKMTLNKIYNLPGHMDIF